MATERVLVVDQDAAHCAYLCLALEFEGLEAVVAHSASEALGVLRRESFDVVAVDLQTARQTRPDVVDFVLQHLTGMPAIVLAEPLDVDMAVKALGDGAFDFFTKPVQPEVVVNAVQRAVRHSALQQEATIYRLSRVVFEIDDPDMLMDEITLLARRALSADLAAVLRPSSEGLRPEFAAWSDRTGGAPLPLDALTGLGARALATAEAQLGHEGHVLAVPVTCRRAPGVVLALAREATRRAFFRPDVETASLVASQAALALDNASLVSELRSRVDQLDRTRRRLSSREHLEALGQAAMGVTYHVRDPLLYVRRQLDAISAQVDAVTRGASCRPDELRQAVDDALSGLDRVEREITDLSHVGSDRPADDLRTVTVAELAVRMTAGKVPIQVDVQPAIVPGHLAQLALALAHLLRNAVGAAAERTAPYVALTAVLRGDRVVFEVSDNGRGLPAPVRAEVEGAAAMRPESGLGRCRRIAVEHGGSLEVYLREGGGTVVRLTLPGSADTELPVGDD